MNGDVPVRKSPAIKNLRGFIPLAVAFLFGIQVNNWWQLVAVTKPVVVECPHTHLPQIQRDDFLSKDNGATNTDICPIPVKTIQWRYHRTLVDINANTAALARNVTNNQSNIQMGESPIPHRLVFTHKYNILDCDISAHVMTPPDLYTIAENAKATINLYKSIWSDLEVVFLTDAECREAINATEPKLIPYFDTLTGMFKADLCRSAYIALHGGYYFDVDLLVVRPYIASSGTKFVSVKGNEFPTYGFFQAFMAAEASNIIVRKSLKIMLGLLEGTRKRRKLLGPVALAEAWMETEVLWYQSLNKAASKGRSKNEAHHLLAESKLAQVGFWADKLPLQTLPTGYGNPCQFSGVNKGSSLCDHVVKDESDDTVYFYSRIQGTRWCHNLMRDETAFCPEKAKANTKSIWEQ